MFNDDKICDVCSDILEEYNKSKKGYDISKGHYNLIRVLFLDISYSCYSSVEYVDTSIDY